jgi:hypothetical protein
MCQLEEEQKKKYALENLNADDEEKEEDCENDDDCVQVFI